MIIFSIDIFKLSFFILTNSLKPTDIQFWQKKTFEKLELVGLFLFGNSTVIEIINQLSEKEIYLGKNLDFIGF